MRSNTLRIGQYVRYRDTASFVSKFDGSMTLGCPQQGLHNVSASNMLNRNHHQKLAKAFSHYFKGQYHITSQPIGGVNQTRKW